ncbi:MAG: hypothetical protein ACM3MM_06070 [Acidobacteriota bacterium]
MVSIVDSEPVGSAIADGAAVEVPSAGVTVVPPPGWRLLGGSSGRADRKGSVTGWIELIDDEVCVTVRTGPFRGSADGLLDEIVGVNGDIASPPPRRWLVQGVNGATWILTEYHGPDDDYIAAALAVDRDTPSGRRERVGVEVVAEGWPDALESRVAVIESLIASIRC